MKVKSDFQAIGSLINIAREENHGKILSVDDLKRILGGILPVNDLARSWLVKAEVIVRVGRGKYMFPNDPISWISIKKFYDIARDAKRQHRLKSQNPVAHEVHVKPVISKESEYSEEKAVAFLKNRGYVILKMM
jgi:hypothetical protein